MINCRRQVEIILPPATDWIPDRSIPHGQHQGRYQGPRKKPWDYDCEVCIPVLDVWEGLPTIIQLLRLQRGVRPYIVLIDTGSLPENWAKVEALRADDVEVHTLRFGAVRHPSDPVAAALDLHLSICRTEYLFLTHADVFLRRNDFLKDLMAQCNADTPGVGYQMSPRGFPGWEEILSHTATMLHMPTIDRILGCYSLRRLCARKNVEHRPNSWADNWPDTEQLMTYLMQDNGMKPLLIGSEPNHEPTIDRNIYHARSITAANLYAPGHHKRALVWLGEAIKEGQANIRLWSDEKP